LGIEGDFTHQSDGNVLPFGAQFLRFANSSSRYSVDGMLQRPSKFNVMQAIVCERFGSPDVLSVRQFADPIPKHDEVLIRVRASTVNSGDSRIRSFTLPRGFGPIARFALGFRAPRQPILGTELAGDVVAAGAAVSRFQVGDRVFAFPGMRMGAHAQLVCMRERGNVARMPSLFNYAEASALSFAGTTVIDFFRRAQLKSGERIVINGASGAVGTAAIQIAKARGAVVTAVCSAFNAALVSSLGADHVIDYSQHDFTTVGARFDVILDAVGNVGMDRARPCLNDGGRLLLLVPDLPTLLSLAWYSVFERRSKIIAGSASERKEDLDQLLALAEAGHFRPVIDRRFSFDRFADAHRYVDTGRKRGSVVIDFD
jgi:NADPH:quinone reductase-like Zn-dependent oxidoreductase